MANNKIFQLNFEASANLQRLIGRELVPNEEMAVIELVKNAYDAGATKVSITIQPESDKEPGYIEIRDDGQGMTLQDLDRLFMFAGYSERPNTLGRSKRVPTGEKGIGRFASDKLGKKLTITTKLKNKNEGIQLNIDWEAFRNKKKKFSEITASGTSGPVPGFELGESGTTLLITNLRGKWSRQLLEALRSKLGELTDPFYRPKHFEVDLQVRGSHKLSGPIRSEKPGVADIELDFKVLRDGTTKRKLSYPSTELPDEIVSLSPQPQTLALGGLTGHFYYSLKRPTKEVTKGLTPGVRLYRDGFRIEPFGSPTADWLGISEKRAKRAGHAHIVPSRLFGFVEISRQEHPDLQDTTSRQSLIDSDVARGLVSFLLDQLRVLEDSIRKEVSEPRWKESRQRRALEQEQARLQTLGIMSFGLAHELRQPLQTIRTEANNITTRLSQLGIKDSEIEEAQHNIDDDIDRIDKRINLIASISAGNIQDITTFDLAEHVRELCHPFEAEYATKGIDITVNAPASQQTQFNRFAVAQVLLNLLQNAVESVQELKGTRGGKVIVSLSRVGMVHCLDVIDNGVGISEEVRPKIFKRFTSKKTGGMGVGLHLCHTTIAALGGEIKFTSRENVGTTFSVKFSDRNL